MRRRLLLDPREDPPRHRLAQLLADMSDQTDRAGHHADSAHDVPRQADLARHRRNRPSRIDRERLAQALLAVARDRSHQLDILTGKSVGGGDLEQLWRARVDRLVEAVADAGNGTLARP